MKLSIESSFGLLQEGVSEYRLIFNNGHTKKEIVRIVHQENYQTQAVKGIIKYMFSILQEEVLKELIDGTITINRDELRNGIKKGYKKITFEDYVQDIHAKQYQGLDDEMPLDYEKWLSELEVDDWISFGDNYISFLSIEETANNLGLT